MAYGGRKFHGKKAVPGEEKKPRNWPKIINEIKYDSPLEFYTAELLRSHHIRFEFKRKYTLFTSFNYAGETVMGLTLTVDFYLLDYDIILDPKGNQNEGNPIKWKLLKKWLSFRKLTPRIIFVYSQKEALAFVIQLKHGFKENVKPGTVNTRIKKLKRVTKLVGSDFLYTAGGKTTIVCHLEDLQSMTSYDFEKLLNNLL